MSIKIGDKVKFLNDVGTGVVTRMIDAKTAGVLNEDGFEIPSLLTELIKVDEEAQRQEQVFAGTDEEDTADAPAYPDVSSAELGEYIKDDTQNDVYLAILPKDTKKPDASDLDFYLINDSNYSVLFQATVPDGNYMKLVGAGELEDNTKVHLASFTKETINEMGEVVFQMLFYRRSRHIAYRPLDRSWKVKPARFFQSSTFKNNDFFHQKAYVYKLTGENQEDKLERLTDKQIEKEKKQKLRGEKGPQKQPHVNPDTHVEEVDLHIQELVEHDENLSAGEILDIQMSRFTTALEGAIRAKTKKIVFIHGVGNGRLKHKLRKTLETDYPRLRYQDASFKEYGYGATMVLIK
ncbi:MAG: DUF2027 domain-containing protein [Bacteroidota bacterium]